MVLAITGSQTAAAVVIPAHAVRLTALGEGRGFIAVKNAVTFSVRDIEAEPGSDAPIAIKLPTAAELRAANAGVGTFLLVRNIPEGVSLSAGMATGRICVVPLREASTLRLKFKPDVDTPFQLEFYLIGPDSHVLAETIVTVDLSPPQAVAALAPPAPKLEDQKPAAPPRPEAAPLTPREEAVLLTPAKELLGQGGIAAARVIYEDLAAHGSASGALELARSYDPAYAGSPKGFAPATNMAEARKWYERAAELGNPDAKRRLVEIASGR